MSINLLEAIQTKLGYPALQKIDPNTQKVVDDSSTPSEDQFSQAAIPAVLTTLYDYSRTDEGAENILQNSVFAGGTNLIFAGKEENIIQQIADYSGKSNEITREKVNTITATGVNFIKENLPEQATIHDVRIFLAGQKNNILSYLPAALHTGELLHDNTLDDNTNKMGGLLSGLMHTLGDTFSGGEVKKEDII